MTAEEAELQDWLQLVRAEYEELPDLRLTQAQVEQLWGLRAFAAEALLKALVAAGILEQTRHGVYLRVDREMSSGEAGVTDPAEAP